MAVKVTTALQRGAKKAARRGKSMITDDYGSSVMGGRGLKAQQRLANKNAKPKGYMDKANSMYQQNVGRVKSVAGKAGLYDSMLKGKDGKVKGGLTTKGKMAVGGAVGLAGAGMAAGAYNKRQEDKKFKNRVKDRLGIRR